MSHKQQLLEHHCTEDLLCNFYHKIEKTTNFCTRTKGATVLLMEGFYDYYWYFHLLCLQQVWES
jgi:hypothetical protein